MKVADVMTRGLDLMSPDDTVQQAAVKMAEADIGAILVGTAEALAGILTDRDIILRLVIDGLSSAEVRVRDIMSSTLFTCRENDSLEQAFAQMSDHQVRRLPVLDEADRLVGIVTLSDLCRQEPDAQRTSELLRAIAEPHRDRRSDKPAETGKPEEATGLDASAPAAVSGPPDPVAPEPETPAATSDPRPSKAR
ncbi:MAG TPA: CBS domain-containing protein [Burkholderiaceae bacterium]|nr:CBS domain-containing protein [Burkholderiaceae bacterium]